MAVRPDDELVISYLALRKFIGILGILFPLILMAGARLVFHQGFQPSLSDYYHTGMRDVFVGILWAIGVFLVSYHGYDKRDDIAGDLACLFAVGLSVCPVATAGGTGEERTIGEIHFAFAAAFFAVLIYFSLFLFVKSKQGPRPVGRKAVRNRYYRVCGWVMAACVAGIAVFKGALGNQWVQDHYVVLILETIAISAFGLSWLVKGEAILKDREDEHPAEMIATGTSGN
jgi:hypothetical protein